MFRKDKKVPYDRLVLFAMRGVLKEALCWLEKNQDISESYFNIWFKTTVPGVEAPDYLLEEYPDNMFIILQHQFWDLKVEDNGFRVTLSFNGDSLERIFVPFNSIIEFLDPEADFGVNFSDILGEGDDPKKGPSGGGKIHKIDFKKNN